jgi:hypothetical protein
MTHNPASFSKCTRWERLTNRLGVVLCLAIATTTLADEDDSAPPKGSLLLEWSIGEPRTNAYRPRLRVWSGGLVESWQAGQPDTTREQRVPSDVQKWVQSVSDRIRESKLSTRSLRATLEAEFRRTGRSFQIRGADSSTIVIQHGSSAVEVTCPAPALLAERFPDLQPLQDFVAIERNLQNFASIIDCGGETAARTLCELANEQLRRSHPDAPAWTISDLSMVRTLPSGSRFVQFRRDGNPMDAWSGCLTESPGQPLRVTIIPPASASR